jgi:general secretion pathway protein K
MVLLGLLFTQLLASGRSALALASNLRNAAEARAQADGAINLALFHLLSTGSGQWAADGSLHDLDGHGTITVQVRSLADKINPNLASTSLLAGLFQASGAPSVQAQQLAQAIIQWRSPQVSQQATNAILAEYRKAGLSYGPPGRPFLDLSELGNIIGMTPALLALVLPHLSLYQTTDPNPAVSDAIIRRALILSGPPAAGTAGYNGSAPVVTIEAIVKGQGGAVARRDAIASIAGANTSTPFQILSLTDGQ